MLYTNPTRPKRARIREHIPSVLHKLKSHAYNRTIKLVSDDVLLVPFSFSADKSHRMEIELCLDRCLQDHFIAYICLALTNVKH